VRVIVLFKAYGAHDASDISGLICYTVTYSKSWEM
jgi:hypothetical protein